MDKHSNAYTPPKLTVVGSLEELTLFVPNGSY